MMAIRKSGATIVSLAPGEETFANGDDLGSWVTTLVKQNAKNAEKSRTVKVQTWRGVQSVMNNGAHYGPLPMLWATRGVRYSKQAFCTDAGIVTEIYQAVADGESLQSVGRRYDAWPRRNFGI